ncbi:MAG: response regulator transcription factor [Actinobacteria bacterium]|nr:response regulator transcription factor [Actinomycetota bacterium]
MDPLGTVTAHPPARAGGPTRVVVQERRRLFREGLAMVLSAQPDLHVVGAVADAHGLVDACGRLRPDVALLELDEVGWDTPPLIALLVRRHPGLRVVGLHAELDRVWVQRARQGGVGTPVPRAAGVESVLDAVRGGPGWSRVTPLPRRTAQDRDRLTAREIQVLALIGSGATSQEISGRLGISRKTVENHKQRIFPKLEVQNQAHAVAVAMRRGLVFGDALHRPAAAG